MESASSFSPNSFTIRFQFNIKIFFSFSVFFSECSEFPTVSPGALFRHRTGPVRLRHLALQGLQLPRGLQGALWRAAAAGEVSTRRGGISQPQHPKKTWKKMVEICGNLMISVWFEWILMIRDDYFIFHYDVITQYNPSLIRCSSSFTTILIDHEIHHH